MRAVLLRYGGTNKDMDWEQYPALFEITEELSFDFIYCNEGRYYMVSKKSVGQDVVGVIEVRINKESNFRIAKSPEIIEVKGSISNE